MNLSNPQKSHGMSWTCDTTVSPMTRWICSPILAVQQQIVELRISIPSSKDVDKAILPPKLEPNGRPKMPSHHLSKTIPHVCSYIQSMGKKQNIPKSVQDIGWLTSTGKQEKSWRDPPTPPTTNHLNSSEKMTQTYSRMPPTFIKIWVWVSRGTIKIITKHNISIYCSSLFVS